jgi:tRNA (guanosine-2'-O-)-methyltransferase
MERHMLRFPPAPADFTLKRLDNESGTYGPMGLYGGRVARTDLLDLFRNAIKPARLARIENVLLSRTNNVTVVLENLGDPGNASAVCRTAEAMGLAELHVVESFETFRTTGAISMNAEKWITTQRYRHCIDAVEHLRASGYTIVATCLDDDAVDIDAVDFEGMCATGGRIAVLLGNEERGLSKTLLQAADVKVCIPMSGMSQCLNIATTCGIFLAHLRSRGLMQPRMEDAVLTELYAKWMIMSTKNSAALIEKHGMADQMPEFM